MAKQLVQINFNYAMSRTALEQGAKEVVTAIPNQPGLLWKIWICNDQEKITGGIYLFVDAESAQAYIDGPVIEALRSTPDFNGFSIRQFDLMDALNAATQAPV